MLEQQRLTEDQARVYFLQALQGLEYIHSKGYAHRDIKPENLLLDHEGKLKIADFGLSNSLKSGEFLKTQCGSPNYAAPEVISGEKYCGSEVDVWSLGVVLYALMARELPFDDPSIPLLFARIKSGEFKVQHHFSESLKDLVQRMLTVDPITRINIQQIKNHPWLKCSTSSDFNSFTNERIIRMYTSNEIQGKVLKQVLKMNEFREISLKNAGEQIQKRRESKGFEMQGDDLSTTFNILLDIELQVQLQVFKSCETPIKQEFSKMRTLSYVHSSALTTASSSDMEELHEKTPPNNWVYGFRSNLPTGYLEFKLFEGFKELGLKWRVKPKLQITLRGENIKVLVIIYKYEGTSVIDCTRKWGSLMEYYEVLHGIYSTILKFTHVQ